MSVKDMKTDMDYFYSALKEAHPNCFVYLTEKEFDKKIDSIKQSITQPLTKAEFYLSISEINQYLDLHTHIYPDKKTLKKQKLGYKMPNWIEKKDGIYFYQKDITKDTFNHYYKLLSVNNIEVKDINSFFLSRNNKVEPYIGYNFQDRLSFYIFDHLIDGTLTLVGQEMDTSDNSVLGIDTMFLQSRKKTKKQKDDFLNLSLDSIQSIAVIRINTFYPGGIFAIQRFNDTLDNYFQKLKDNKIKRLYVDVSKNGGGYLALEEDVVGRFFDDDKSRFSGNFTMKLSKYSRMQKLIALPVKNGDFYHQNRYFTPSKHKNKYINELYVIQSRYSFSAASCFSAHLQTYNRAKIIGETSQVKAVYTDPISLKLPKSKFMFQCATQYEKNVGNNKHLGVVPDIPYYIYNPSENISIEAAEKMRLSK